MPLIAMTREMGSLGKDVAARLAARRRGRVVYHEIADPAANSSRLRRSHVERFVDGAAGIWERPAAERTERASFTPDETFPLLRDDSVAVIRGWGAAQLLRSVSHVVRVRICASLELRVERMMRRLSTENREAVESEIRLSEEAHTAIARRHFCLNWKDAENYDLVLSTDRLGVDECVEQLEATVAMTTFQETEQSRQRVDELEREWRVRAALRRDPRTAAAVVTVRCAGPVVTLAGVVETPGEAAAAAQVAAAVHGARGVDNQLQPVSTAFPRYRRGA